MKIQIKYLAAISVVALMGTIYFWQFEKAISPQKLEVINDKSVDYIPNDQFHTEANNEEVPKEPLSWKVRYIDSVLQIQLPEQKPDFPEPSVSDSPYFAKKDGFESVDLYPNNLKNPTRFFAIASIGFADYSENQIRFQSTFYVYKASANLKNKRLIDWISQSQKNMWNPDFPISDLPSLQARNRELKSPIGTELVYFHMPVPSDNGWYAYRYGDKVYLFGLGNSSIAVKGSREGLWDEMMETLKPYEVPVNQPGNINNLQIVSGRSDMVWYPVSELGIEIKVRKDIAKEIVYKVEKLQSDNRILSAMFTTRRLLEIADRSYGKTIESNGYYVCQIGFFTRYDMSEKEYLSFLSEMYGDDYSTYNTPTSVDGYFVRYTSPQSGCSQEASDGKYEEKIVTSWWGMPTSEYTENTNFDQVLRESVRRIR